MLLRQAIIFTIMFLLTTLMYGYLRDWTYALDHGFTAIETIWIIYFYTMGTVVPKSTSHIPQDISYQ